MAADTDEKNEKVKETIRKKVAEYIDRMEKLKAALDQKRDEPKKKVPSSTAKYEPCRRAPLHVRQGRRLCAPAERQRCFEACAGRWC